MEQPDRPQPPRKERGSYPDPEVELNDYENEDDNEKDQPDRESGGDVEPLPRWWRPRLFAMLLLVVMVLTAGVFTYRAVNGARKFSTVQEEPLQPWMTLPYVGKSYGVPPEVLFKEAGLADQLPSKGHQPTPQQEAALKRLRHKTLGQIAQEHGESFEPFKARLEESIKQNGGQPPHKRRRSQRPDRTRAP